MALLVTRLELGFDLEGGGRDFRTVTAAAPTTDHKIFVTLVRAQLESHPLRTPLSESPWWAWRRERVQSSSIFSGLPGPPLPPWPVCGSVGRVVWSRQGRRIATADSHRPDAVEVGRFEGESSRRSSAVASDDDPVIRLALRAFRPPIPLEVFERAVARLRPWAQVSAAVWCIERVRGDCGVIGGPPIPTHVNTTTSS